MSNVTLSFLNGDFKVEPGYGERREEALAKAGLTTYFIVRAVKPFKPVNNKSPIDGDPNNYLDDRSNEDFAEYRQRLREELIDRGKDSEEFRQRLRQELTSKGKGTAVI